MKEALFISEDGNKIIRAEDITKYEYQTIYKGKIYCTYKGCNAEYEFVDLQKNRNSGCFRTLKNHKHIAGCPNESTKEGERGRRILVQGEGGIELSTKHVKQVLKDAYNLASGKKSTSKSVKYIKKNKSKTLNTDIPDESVPKQGIKVGKTVTKVTQEKQPYIYKKGVSDFLISPKDIYCVYGDVVSVDIGEEEVFIKIKDSTKSMYVYIGTPFKVNYPQQFKLLKAFKLYLEKLQGERIVCTCICVSQEKNGEIVGEVMDYKNIDFNGLDLFSVIRFVNNLVSV